MRYIVRLATEFDAPQIQNIYEPYVIETPATFELDAPDVSDIRRRVIETLVHYPWLVCEDSDGAILGYAYGSQHRVRSAYQWSADVSVYVDRRYHGLGVGKSLYKGLLGILALQGYCTAYAGITLPNPSSVRLHEGLGFTKVGVFKDTGFKLGEWRDVGWWELQLRQYDINPKTPVPFTAIAQSRKVLELLATLGLGEMIAAGQATRKV
jgi:L-amino acid N-acyltransferase YncA